LRVRVFVCALFTDTAGVRTWKTAATLDSCSVSAPEALDTGISEAGILALRSSNLEVPSKFMGLAYGRDMKFG